MKPEVIQSAPARISIAVAADRVVRTTKLAQIPRADFDRDALKFTSDDPKNEATLRQLKAAWYRATPQARDEFREWVAHTWSQPTPANDL